MEKWKIDINCDVGEGVGNETHLLPLISSCNIACGGHAGDLLTMERVISIAKKNNVKIGAHPSYPDKHNFGRKVLSISEGHLKSSIVEQLKIFDRALNKGNADLHHIKAHGALYNETAKNENLALVYLDAIKPYRDNVFVYVPYNSIISRLAVEKGFKITYEAFADRNYNTDLSLVSRNLENALIQEPKQVLAHVLSIIKEGKVQTVTDEHIAIRAETLCIHGDTPSALQILMYLSQELPNHGVQLT